MAGPKIENVILLPIFPKYADAIFSGIKRFEFRQARVPDAEFVVLYATTPKRQIVGYFEVQTVHRKSPKVLWADFSKFGAITKEEFFRYYSGREEGAAFEVGTVWQFLKPMPLSDLSSAYPPQGFRYLREEDWGKIRAFKSRPSALPRSKQASATENP